MASFLQATVERISNLITKLRNRADESKKKDPGKFTVGYGAPYAVYVHENLNAVHPHGQAKFLEKPAREMQSDLANTITTTAKAGLGLQVANQKAAVQLLEASQELVPVDTGTLKASGFVRNEQTGEIVAGSEETATELQFWRSYLKSQQRQEAQAQRAQVKRPQ